VHLVLLFVPAAVVGARVAAAGAGWQRCDASNTTLKRCCACCVFDVMLLQALAPLLQEQAGKDVMPQTPPPNILCAVVVAVLQALAPLLQEQAGKEMPKLSLTTPAAVADAVVANSVVNAVAGAGVSAAGAGWQGRDGQRWRCAAAGARLGAPRCRRDCALQRDAGSPCRQQRCTDSHQVRNLCFNV
jgi:hypothetical protein